MGTNANAIEKKIICLKTQYNRELKKLKSSNSAAGFNEVCNWYAFEQMHFFKDRCVPKNSADLVKITDDLKKGVATVAKNCNSNVSTNTTTQKQKLVTKNSYKIENDSQIGVSYAINETDEFSLFGEAIACVLREIKSERKVLELKKKIMNLVYDTKLKMLDTAKARVNVLNKIEKDESKFEGNKIEVIVDGKRLEDTEIT